MRCRVVCLVIAWVCTPLGVVAQRGERPDLTIGRVSDARPIIDGVVDDEVWNSVSPFSTFIQQEPNEGEPATERTEIRFLLDRQNLYVSLICFDSEPQNILVSQSRRDADLGDTDSVRILLDTFNDGQNAFVFGTNPFGIEYDGQVMAESAGRSDSRAVRRHLSDRVRSARPHLGSYAARRGSYVNLRSANEHSEVAPVIQQTALAENWNTMYLALSITEAVFGRRGWNNRLEIDYKWLQIRYLWRRGWDSFPENPRPFSI